MLEYIEDPFSENDNKGFHILKNALESQYPNVKIGMQAPFKDSRIDKVKDVTKPKTPEQLAEEQKLAEQPPPIIEEKGAKKPPGKP